jgi:hypothetical protein
LGGHTRTNHNKEDIKYNPFALAPNNVNEFASNVRAMSLDFLLPRLLFASIEHHKPAFIKVG